MNFLNFFMVKTLAEGDGIGSQRATQLGLLTSFLPGSTGLLVGIVAARREAPPPANTSSASGPSALARSAAVPR